MLNNLLRRKKRTNPKVQPDSGNDEAQQQDSVRLNETCKMYKNDRSLMSEFGAQRCATGNRVGMSADEIQLCECAGIVAQPEEIVPTKRLLEPDHDDVVVRGDWHKLQTTRVGGKRHKSRKQRKSRKRRKSHRRKSFKRRKSRRKRR